MAAPSQRSYPPTFPTNSGLSQNPFISSPLASGTRQVSNSSSQNTNPFRRPKPTPNTFASSAAFSPVSPIQDVTRSTLQPISRSPNMSDSRRSVDLRTIDGKPYPGSEDKPRTVKVAQDMYAGDMPPGYDSHGYKTPPSGEKGEKGEKGHKHTDSCGKCGGQKKAPVAATPPSPLNIDCNQCGQKRSTPPSSFPGASARVPPIYPPIQSGEAGPSNARRHQCTKCGRRKRPESSPDSVPSAPARVSNHRSVPSIQTNGIPVDINIEPPTAINERAPTLPMGSPLGAPLTRDRAEPQQKRNHSRSNSISSLFRSLSRRKKSPDGASPTSSDSKNSRRGTSYSRLGDQADRPPSPFSFVDKPREDQAFEMNDMRRSKQPERRDSWEKADETTGFLGQPRRPRIGRSQSTTAAKYPGDARPVDDVYLSLPPDQRPGITRFKSLRGGVTRAADGLSRSASQISRSSSLRRLSSVKKVPSLWYRDDMAIEGAGGEYNNYAY